MYGGNVGIRVNSLFLIPNLWVANSAPYRPNVPLTYSLNSAVLYRILGAICIPERYLPQATVVLTIAFVVNSRLMYFYNKREQVKLIIHKKLSEKMRKSLQKLGDVLQQNLTRNDAISNLKVMVSSIVHDVCKDFPLLQMEHVNDLVASSQERMSEMANLLATDLGVQEVFFKLVVATYVPTVLAVELVCMRNSAHTLNSCLARLLVAAHTLLEVVCFSQGGLC